MIAYLVRRLLHGLVTLVVAVVLVFVAMRMLPNNPALSRFGQHPVPEQVTAEMQRQGWDKPIWVQLGTYAWDVLTRGDFGESFVHPGISVARLLGAGLGGTVELTALAILIALPCGVALGVAAAVWRNSLPDYLCTTGSLLGMSIPVFFLGYCLIRLIPWAPPAGRLSPTAPAEFREGLVLCRTAVAARWDLFRDALEHLCLPAITLSTIPLSIISRITRGAMLEVLSADFVRTARAKGLSFARVVLRHALPNAGVPIANIAGFQIGSLLSGAVLTETVFAWPGLGRALTEAAKASDYAVVQAGALIVAAVFVLLNLGLDLLYLYLDPRIRRE